MVRIEFVAVAPAPLIATPVPPIATETEAAVLTAKMLADSLAEIVTSPSVTVTPVSAFVMYDETSLLMLLRATDTPIDMATPVPPNPAASVAAPVMALIAEVSLAMMEMEPAAIPVAPSPSMKELILAEIRLKAVTPAPDTETPVPPAEAATDPAITGLCDNVLLFQGEYRGRLSFDWFSGDDDDFGRRYGATRHHTRRDDVVDDSDFDWFDDGWFDGPTLVLFSNAGAGWLAGQSVGTLNFDVGAGIELGGLGFYVAKAIKEDEPVRVTLRISRRF